MRPDILDMMDLDMPPSDASEPVAALWWLAKGAKGLTGLALTDMLHHQAEGDARP